MVKRRGNKSNQCDKANNKESIEYKGKYSEHRGKMAETMKSLEEYFEEQKIVCNIEIRVEIKDEGILRIRRKDNALRF